MAVAINTLVAVGKGNCTVSLNDTEASQKLCFVVQLLVYIIFFDRTLGNEQNFYCCCVNCRVHGLQVSVNSCVC